MYGVRRYTNNSRLLAHVDKLSTHVISAILNIGQDVVDDWPLYILDNLGGRHTVTLRPGEMVWYESARLAHGRPLPLNGRFFDNLFIHYKPRRGWYNRSFQFGDRPVKSFPMDYQDVVDQLDDNIG